MAADGPVADGRTKGWWPQTDSSKRAHEGFPGKFWEVNAAASSEFGSCECFFFEERGVIALEFRWLALVSCALTLANLFGGSQQTCKALSKLAHRVTPLGDPLG